MIYWLQQAHSLLRDDSILSWIAIAVFSVLVTSLIKAILKIVSHYLRALAQKTASIWDDVAVDLLDGFKSWVLIVWVFYISTKSFRREALYKSTNNLGNRFAPPATAPCPPCIIVSGKNNSVPAMMEKSGESLNS